MTTKIKKEITKSIVTTKDETKKPKPSNSTIDYMMQFTSSS